MRLVLLLAVAAFILVVLLPLLRRSLSAGRGRPLGGRDELVKDPVCQTYVLRSRAITRGGDASPYFCSEECARRWTGSPAA